MNEWVKDTFISLEKMFIYPSRIFGKRTKVGGIQRIKKIIDSAVGLFIRVMYGPRQFILYQKDLNILA